MRLVCDEAKARAIADIMVEISIRPKPLRRPSRRRFGDECGRHALGGRSLFGPAPDEAAIRALVAAAAGERQLRL